MTPTILKVKYDHALSKNVQNMGSIILPFKHNKQNEMKLAIQHKHDCKIVSKAITIKLHMFFADSQK